MAGYESDETQNQCTGKLDSGDILRQEKSLFQLVTQWSNSVQTYSCFYCTLTFILD